MFTLLLETGDYKAKSRFDPSSPFVCRQQLTMQSTHWQIGQPSSTSVHGDGSRACWPPSAAMGYGLAGFCWKAS